MNPDQLNPAPDPMRECPICHKQYPADMPDPQCCPGKPLTRKEVKPCASETTTAQSTDGTASALPVQPVQATDQSNAADPESNPPGSRQDQSAESIQQIAVGLVLAERKRQREKWGEQSHDMPTWMCILHEETGELSEAILHEKFGGPEAVNIEKEAIQVAAVALQIVEYLQRNK